MRWILLVCFNFLMINIGLAFLLWGIPRDIGFDINKFNFLQFKISQDRVLEQFGRPHFTQDNLWSYININNGSLIIDWDGKNLIRANFKLNKNLIFSELKIEDKMIRVGTEDNFKVSIGSYMLAIPWKGQVFEISTTGELMSIEWVKPWVDSKDRKRKTFSYFLNKFSESTSS